MSEADMEALARARSHAKWDGDAAAIAWAQHRIAQLELRVANMTFAWERLRDSPQATPDIRRVATSFAGEKTER